MAQFSFKQMAKSQSNAACFTQNAAHIGTQIWQIGQ